MAGQCRELREKSGPRLSQRVQRDPTVGVATCGTRGDSAGASPFPASRCAPGCRLVPRPLGLCHMYTLFVGSLFPLMEVLAAAAPSTRREWGPGDVPAAEVDGSRSLSSFQNLF